MKWKIKRKIDSIKEYISERIEDLGLNAITEFWINTDTLITMIYSLDDYPDAEYFIIGFFKSENGRKQYRIDSVPRPNTKEGIIITLIYEVEDGKRD